MPHMATRHQNNDQMQLQSAGASHYRTLTPSSSSATVPNSLHDVLKSASIIIASGQDASTARADKDMQRQLEEFTRSVTIVFWYKANIEPLRLPHMIPTFPCFQLSLLTSLTTDLGLSPTSYLDTFNPQSGGWEQHTISTVRIVEPQQRILYRMRKSLLEGLSEGECPGLRDEMNIQSKPGPVTIIRAPAPQPESATQGASTFRSIDQPSSPIESNTQGSLKRRTTDTPSLDHIQGQPDKVHIPNDYYMQQSPIPSPHDVSTNAIAAPSTLATTHPNSTSPTSSKAQSAFGAYLHQSSLYTPPIPYHPHPPLKRWPNDYTVSELSTGFLAMDALIASPSPGGASITQRTAFERVFGSRYVKSTVCRHRGVWRKAQESVRRRFEAMGADEGACWGEFVRRVEGRPPGKGAGAGDVNMIMYHAPQTEGGQETSGAQGQAEEEPAMGSLQDLGPSLAGVSAPVTNGRF